MIIAASSRYFSLETKIGLLRAMGCPVDEPAALALYASRLEAARRRKFLPAVAAAHGSRIGIDINVTAREFGSALVWSVRFEDGSRRDGATSTADCRRDLARRSRGIVDHAPAFRIAAGSAARISRIRGENRRKRRRALSADRFAAALLRAGADRRRPHGSGEWPCSCIRCGRGTIGVSGISSICGC